MSSWAESTSTRAALSVFQGVTPRSAGLNTLDYTTANSANVTLGNSSPTSFYDGQLKFKEKLCVFDSELIPNSLIYPV